MIEAYALAAIALIGAGVALGFVALVSLGIHCERREEASSIMAIPPAGRITRGARAATRAYGRTPGRIGEADLHRYHDDREAA